MALDPRHQANLELAISRRDRAFLTGNSAALAKAQDELDAIWDQLQPGEHTVHVEDPAAFAVEDLDEALELHHHGCPTITTGSLDNYHDHVRYVCQVGRILEDEPLSDFFTAGSPTGEQVQLSAGTYRIEAVIDGKDAWLRVQS